MARALKKASEKRDDSTTEVWETLNLQELRLEHKKLLKEYDRIINGFYCHQCGKFLPRDKFYVSTKTKSGVTQMCKKCLYILGTGYDDKKKVTFETPETLKKALREMNLPFLRDLYRQSVSAVEDTSNSKTIGTVFQQYISMIQSLPQYKGLSWDDSDDYDELSEAIDSVDEDVIKRFGPGLPPKDYKFLDSEYKDWTTRYEAPNKVEEELFKRICFKQLEIHNATLAGRDTKDLDRSLVELLGTMNLKPNQNNANVLSEGRTFGQLIEKWENEKPIPEISEEFRDVDKVGQYIDVFFKGHLSKMMGLKNGFSELYHKFMQKYSAQKPDYNNDDVDDESLFDKIFGRDIGGDQ